MHSSEDVSELPVRKYFSRPVTVGKCPLFISDYVNIHGKTHKYIKRNLITAVNRLR